MTDCPGGQKEWSEKLSGIWANIRREFESGFEAMLQQLLCAGASVPYGTSFVQGGCAPRPGMSYPAIVARRLDHDFINLGFSGNGKTEPENAKFLTELKPSAYILDSLPNLTVEQVKERVAPFVRNPATSSSQNAYYSRQKSALPEWSADGTLARSLFTIERLAAEIFRRASKKRGCSYLLHLGGRADS